MRKVFQLKNLSIMAVVVGVLLLNACQEEYTITAIPNDASIGTVTGSGVYTKGTILQLVALPIIGYQFDKWDDGNTDNPRTITVEKNATYTAIFVVEGGGGEQPTYTDAFSVSETKMVYFSPGNLQWSATGSHSVAGGGTAAGTWRFAPNQWDTIGANNSNISPTYTGWIDLFGWGTSGYNNKYPYMTSITPTDYGNGNKNIAGTNYDWGVYNAIYNPKTNTTDAPGTWRTLTKDEWVYLLNTRPTASSIRYAKATVCGIVGLIIVPDNYSKTYYLLTKVNTSYAAYTSNIIGATDWAKMENVGCVFLPAAVYRSRTSVHGVGPSGGYWSATYSNSEYAYSLDIESDGLYPGDYSYRADGRCVRLVKDVK